MFGKDNPADIGAYIELHRYSIFREVNMEISSMRKELENLRKNLDSLPFVKQEELDAKIAAIIWKMDVMAAEGERDILELEQSIDSVELPDAPDNSEILKAIEGLKAGHLGLNTRLAAVENRKVDLTFIKDELDQVRMEGNFHFVEVVNLMDDKARADLIKTRGRNTRRG